MSFLSGDFVDVAVSFEVVQRPIRDGSGRYKHDVHLSLLHVAQIYKAADVPDVSVFSYILRPDRTNNALQLHNASVAMPKKAVTQAYTRFANLQFDD